MPSHHNYTLSLHDALPISQEEAHNGIYLGNLNHNPYFWVGNTSRDQYSGVLFGLAAAYDLVSDDAQIRTEVTALTTRLIDFLRDRKSTRLNSSHMSISYAVPPQLHSFPTRRSSDLARRSPQRYIPRQSQSQPVFLGREYVARSVLGRIVRSGGRL